MYSTSEIVALGQPPSDRTLHDGMGAVPGEPEEHMAGFQASGHPQDFDGESLEHQGEAGMLSSPRHSDGFDTAIRAVATGDAGFDDRLEIHGIKVPPAAGWGGITLRSGLSAIRTSHILRTMADFDDHAGALHLKIDLVHLPGGLETEKQGMVAVQRRGHAGQPEASCRPSELQIRALSSPKNLFLEAYSEYQIGTVDVSCSSS